MVYDGISLLMFSKTCVANWHGRSLGDLGWAGGTVPQV